MLAFEKINQLFNSRLRARGLTGVGQLAIHFRCLGHEVFRDAGKDSGEPPGKNGLKRGQLQQ